MSKIGEHLDLNPKFHECGCPGRARCFARSESPAAPRARIVRGVRRARRGNTLLLASVTMMALTGFLSLAVDFGRVQLARTQLRDTVDAACRYAVTGLSDGTYLTKAQSVASANTVDMSALELTSGDVEQGTWNISTRVFTPTSSSPNAIRVTGRLASSRNTALPLMFAGVVGKSSIDLSAQSIAYAASSTAPDIVGTTTMNLTGGTQIRRLASESGTVNVGSNGTISVPWGCYIYGNAYHRSTVPTEPGNGITGTNTAMGSDIALPSVSVPGSATNLGALNVGWQGYTVPGGNYSCTSLTVGGGGTFTLTGDVNVYVSGAIDLGNGCVINTSNGAYKLTIYLTSNNTANINMTGSFYARFYGPNATVNLTGQSPLIGSVMCRTLNVDGSATITYTSVLSLSDVAGTSSGGSGTIAIVK